MFSYSPEKLIFPALMGKVSVFVISICAPSTRTTGAQTQHEQLLINSMWKKWQYLNNTRHCWQARHPLKLHHMSDFTVIICFLLLINAGEGTENVQIFASSADTIAEHLIVPARRCTSKCEFFVPNIKGLWLFVRVSLPATGTHT